MKNFHTVELLAKIVRWVVAGILLAVVTIPAVVSLNTPV